VELDQHQYYHLYNRTNNRELLFKSEENYRYFKEKYHRYFRNCFKTVAYCLMPTHFHFLINVLSLDQLTIKKNLAALLSGYTKSINIRFQRHGSLFQPRTKARRVQDDEHLITVIKYMHQNPVRAGLVNKLEEWPYSSYRGLLGLSHDDLIDSELVKNLFGTIDEFRIFSEQQILLVKKEEWI